MTITPLGVKVTVKVSILYILKANFAKLTILPFVVKVTIIILYERKQIVLKLTIFLLK